VSKTVSRRAYLSTYGKTLSMKVTKSLVKSKSLIKSSDQMLWQKILEGSKVVEIIYKD
jgi:hypothetical protein